jgi:hypothetical protein
VFQTRFICQDRLGTAIEKATNKSRRFRPAGSYYLWASGTLGWTPVQGYLYQGPTPLGPFNSTLGAHRGNSFLRRCFKSGKTLYLPRQAQDTHMRNAEENGVSTGHGWHAFVKGPNFNSSGGGGGGSYTMRNGYLPSGHDWIPQRQTTLYAH